MPGHGSVVFTTLPAQHFGTFLSDVQSVNSVVVKTAILSMYYNPVALVAKKCSAWIEERGLRVACAVENINPFVAAPTLLNILYWY